MDRSRIYAYSPLEEPRTIRVVELLDSSGDELDCSLIHGRVDKLKYQCLSYVWGKPDKPFKINVRDRGSGAIVGHIPVTLNLHNALQDLRNSRDIQNKVFWIDQICIHQEDNVEKGRQVALMGEIYKAATAVIMYLGPAAAHDEAGIQLTMELYKHFEPCIHPILDMTWPFAYRRSKPLPVEGLPDSVTLEHPGWPALLDMAFGTWTERTWIVQENVLNQDTFMLRGQKKLEWVSMASMVLFFGVELLPLSLLKDLRENGKKNSSLDCYIDAVYRSMGIRSQTVKGFLTLTENLEWYDALDCADPRDHIYSIMGLSTDTKLLGIEPDYSHSVQTVFVDASVRILSTYKELRFFHYVSVLDNLSDTSYPSWALTPRLLGRQHYLDNYRYAAHPCKTAEFGFDPTYTELTVKGRTIDKILFSSSGTLVQGSTFWGITELEDAERLVTELLAFASIFNNIGTTTYTVTQLFLALIAEKLRDSNLRTDSVLSLWCYTHYCWAQIIQHRASLPSDAQKVLPIIEAMLTALTNLANKNQNPDLTDHEREIGKQINAAKITYGRSFGVTNQNRIVNFTFKAEVGDFIALLQGGSTLYILRPFVEKFKFVGDVCVPGIMYGEAYTDTVPNDVDYEIPLV
jgi:hypothetical protein